MKFVMFTKPLPDHSPDQLAETVRDLGFDGFDLCVRPGYSISPDNVATALPAAAKRWGEQGLTVEMITTAGDFLDPAQPEVGPIFGAAADIGCRHIKLGYWNYRGESYWEKVEEIRAALADFEKLGEQHGLCVSVHTHSGPCYGSSCAATMNLVKGFDPRYIGLYFDPYHLATDGEWLPMAFSMVREYLDIIAVKNCGLFRREVDGALKWVKDTVPVRDGIVDWKLVLELAKQHGYDGIYSVHEEYDYREPLEARLAQVRDDLSYIKGLVAEI